MTTNDHQTRPGWIVSGIVEAPVAEVWGALLHLSEYLSATEKATIHENGAPFTTTKGAKGEGRVYVEVDPHLHSIAIQGEWWYGGVTTVEPHPKGSLITNSVYNIAPAWVGGRHSGSKDHNTLASCPLHTNRFYRQLLNGWG